MVLSVIGNRIKWKRMKGAHPRQLESMRIQRPSDSAAPNVSFFILIMILYFSMLVVFLFFYVN